MIISLLTAFIVLNTLLKLSFWKTWQAAIFGAITFLFVWLCTDYASEQSQVTLEGLLNNPNVLSNITVLLTVETGVCMAFCFVALQCVFKGKESKWHNILQWYPNLLLFPALFYALTQAIFYFSGVSFAQIALGVGGIAFAVIVGGALGIKNLLPEKDLRLELHFLISLLITLLGLISTANGQIIYVPQSEPLNLKVLGATFVFFITLFALGFGLNKGYWYLKQKNKL
ncbi:hypothetical protein [Capnocytophaga bilenii]|jgi:hypothetical protein|uniref:hypothetical protein n=1 Tax=Capnocytophaga bilenii TaxID=2819369 RepID=UPI0028D417BF|nr:hypothetical protein [Capnocytophaga bilenii]